MTSDLSDAPSVLARREARLKLLYAIIDKGFYVRMHAYEYLVGDGRKFVAILLLEPWKKRAFIRLLDPRGRILETVLREMDPFLRVEYV